RRTPLHVAAESGNLDVVDLLLERGADRMAKDVHGHRLTIRHGAERYQKSFSCSGSFWS
ncbi:MAG: ankyrin repeat domain-containing protein, partial [Pseudomonadota bacterium]